jgi:hypothetical protein
VARGGWITLDLGCVGGKGRPGWRAFAHHDTGASAHPTGSIPSPAPCPVPHRHSNISPAPPCPGASPPKFPLIIKQTINLWTVNALWINALTGVAGEIERAGTGKAALLRSTHLASGRMTHVASGLPGVRGFGAAGGVGTVMTPGDRVLGRDKLAT